MKHLLAVGLLLGGSMVVDGATLLEKDKAYLEETSREISDSIMPEKEWRLYPIRILTCYFDPDSGRQVKRTIALRAEAVGRLYDVGETTSFMVDWFQEHGFKDTYKTPYNDGAMEVAAIRERDDTGMRAAAFIQHKNLHFSLTTKCRKDWE